MAKNKTNKASKATNNAVSNMDDCTNSLTNTTADANSYSSKSKSKKNSTTNCK